MSHSGNIVVIFFLRYNSIIFLIILQLISPQRTQRAQRLTTTQNKLNIIRVCMESVQVRCLYVRSSAFICGFFRFLPDRMFSVFSCSYSYSIFHRTHENLTISKVPCLIRSNYGLNHFWYILILDHC